MLVYAARRVLTALLTLLIASFAVYMLAHLLPGDEVRAVFGPNVPPEILDDLHLNDPLVVQYGYFLRDLVTLDVRATLGGAPIRPILAEIVPTSLILLAGVFAMQLVLAPLLLMVTGTRPRSPLDRFGGNAALVLVAVPALVAAFLVQAVFVYWTDLYPSATWVRSASSWRNFSMPVLALGLGTAAHVALGGRDELLLALSQPYVRMARAFGVPPRRILARHALRPTAGAMVQLVSANMAVMVTGLIVVEDVFNVPGIGARLLEAIHDQDRALITTLVLVVLTLVVAVSTLADLVHAWLDPRVRDRLVS